jgi:hypothetical protein
MTTRLNSASRRDASAAAASNEGGEGSATDEPGLADDIGATSILGEGGKSG